VYYLSIYVGWVSYCLTIIRFVVLLKIVNDDTNPSHKIPWLVICLVFPVAGTTLYVIFSKKLISYRQMQMFRKTRAVSSKYSKKHIKSLDKYADISNYICSTSFMPCHDGTSVKYLPTGQDFLHNLIKDLKRAEKFIFMEYFYIKDGIMWQEILKVIKDRLSNGVEVRIMYDDIGTINKVSANFFRKLKKLGIQIVKYNKFKPIISAIHNNRDHRKITIIDGVIAYTGGINIGDEYVNIVHPFGYWKDTALRIEGKAVDNFTIMFLQQYNSQTRKVDMYSNYVVASRVNMATDGYVQPFCDGPKPVYSEQIAQNTYLNMINKARKSIIITTPYFIVDYQILNALKVAVSRGVDVKLIVPGIPDKKMVYALTKSNYRRLLSYGVKVYKYTPGFIHSKMILVDDEMAIVGTMNYDYRSLVHHYEDGVWLCGNECIKDIRSDMLNILDVSEEQTLEMTRMNIFIELFCGFISIFSPMF